MNAPDMTAGTITTMIGSVPAETTRGDGRRTERRRGDRRA
jgi:hypothetical protein